MNNNFLNIPEEIYLLSINENGEQYRDFKNESFDVVLASSILMDLALHHRIDSDQTYIIPDKTEPIGDKLLDGVMKEIIDWGCNRKIEDWISHLSIHGQYFRDEIVKSLVKKGVLKVEDEKILWFFSKRKYPIVDDTELEEVQTRIRTLVFSKELPEEADIVIISILAHSNLLRTVFTHQEIGVYRDRIEEIAKMDFIGQAIASIIDSYEMPGFLDSIFKKKTAEELLQEHVAELKKKFHVTNDDNLPEWIRRGTEQYEKTLEYVREKGHADITFNPRTKEYSELNYDFYYHNFGSGA